MENYTSFSEDSGMGLVNFSAHTHLDRKTHIHTHMKLSPTRTQSPTNTHTHTQARPCPPASNEADNKLLHALL